MKRIHSMLSIGLIAFSMLCNAAESRAEESNQNSNSNVIMKIQLNFNNNQVIEIPLSQIQGISVENTEDFTVFHYLIVDLGNNCFYQIYFYDVDRITYENRNSGIADAEMNTTTLRFEGENVMVFNASDNAELVVYTLDGKTCLSYNLPNGQSVVSLAELPGGVYILSFDNQSFKFAKK